MAYPNPQAVIEAAVDWIFASVSPSGVTLHPPIGENGAVPEAPPQDSQTQASPVAWVRYETTADLEGYLDREADPTGQGDLDITIGIQPETGTEPWRAVWAALLTRFLAYPGASVLFVPQVTTAEPLGFESGWATRRYRVPFWVVAGVEDLAAA